MGGRGSSSGMRSKGGGEASKFNFSSERLSGSEKQKAWAESILYEAQETINRNIARLQEQLKFANKEDYELPTNAPARQIEYYKEIGNGLKNMISKFDKASQVIDMRDKLKPSYINQKVDEYYNIQLNKYQKKRR